MSEAAATTDDVLYVAPWRDGLAAVRSVGDDAHGLHLPLPASALARDDLLVTQVTALDAQQNAAFLAGIDGRALLLSAKDVPHEHDRTPPINRLLHEGERVLVQITRPARDGKGARATMKLSLTGFYWQFQPFGHGIALSRRAQQNTAHAAEDFALSPGGWLLRHSAAAVTRETLLREAETLHRRWQALQGEAAKTTPVRRFDPLPPLTALLLRAWESGPPARVVAHDWPCHAALKRLVDAHGLRVTLEAPDPASATVLNAALDEALSVGVPFAERGRLLIEPTAALTAIDIDAGGLNLPRLEVNLAAMDEAARQIGLRNLGGLIVLDCLDMARAAERQAVMERLKTGLARFAAQTQVLPVSPFGLLQVQRERRGLSVWEIVDGQG